MDAKKGSTTVERKSDRELVVTRTITGPARLVFAAWTKAELLQKWWVPKSAPVTLVSCEVDARVGGSYKLVFELDHAPPMAFVGKYLEVTPPSRLVWTNDEGGPDAMSITTVTFEEKDGKTLVVMSELFPSKEAPDAQMASGATRGTEETFDQLETFITASQG